MTVYGRPDAGALLGDGCPFLGVRPEALLLLQADLVRDCSWGALDEIARTISAAGVSRAQIGAGASFFERAGLSPPRALIPLRLNGDERFGGVPDSTSDVLLACGGSWEDVVAAALLLRERAGEIGLAIRHIHLGNSERSPRDHSGFLDGTSNLQELSLRDFSRCVLVQAEDDPELAGGSYLVFRKYVEDLEMWNDLPDVVQEQMIGRCKVSGAFLTGSQEWSSSVAAATPARSHAIRANPRLRAADDPEFWRDRIFRCGYKFTERNNASSLRYGLLFMALVRDPQIQFARIHNERLLPAEGPTDWLLTAGYITPLTTACYYLPRR